MTGYLLTSAQWSAVDDVLDEVHTEREAQHFKWGEQNHPDGTGSEQDRRSAEDWRYVCQRNFRNGVGTYRDILQEEVAEAFAESDKTKLREELIQVAAVATAWVEKLDREGVK